MLRNTVILLILPSLLVAQCGPGAEYDKDRKQCFMFYTAAVDHSTAESICTTSHGHLASVHNSADNAFLATKAAMLGFKNSPVWLGAKVSTDAQNWIWTDGTYFDYHGDGIQSAFSASGCMQFIAGSNDWTVSDCSSKYPFICAYTPSTVSSVALSACPPSTSQDCPSGYAWFDETNYCYKSVTVFKNYTEAEKSCVREGAQLASIHSQAENDFLVELSKAGITTADVGWNNNVYIGLIYTNGNWKWTDGTAVDYLNWAAGEPNKMNIEFWTTLVADGHEGTNKETEQWNNVANIDERAYICKKSVIS